MEKHRTIIKPPSSFTLDVGELWQYRELLYFFTWRDIKVKYKQTALGILWALLQPLALMLLFTLIFSHTSLASTDSNIPYPVFVLSGLIMWNLFHQSVSHAADSMIVNASIIKKIYFPRLLIPVSNLFTAVFDFVIAFVVFLLLCLYYHQPPDILALVFFPLAILICLIASFGLGSLLGALNVKYRDFRYALPFVLQIGFFMSQVIYSFSNVQNDWLQWIISFNPMNAVIELFRGGLGAEVNFQAVFTGTLTAVTIAIIGVWYFRKTEKFFADIA